MFFARSTKRDESRIFPAHNPVPRTKFGNCYQGYSGRNIFNFGNQREFICVLLAVGNKWDHAAFWSRNWIVVSREALALTDCPFASYLSPERATHNDHLIASVFANRRKRRDRATIKGNNIFRGSSILSLKLPYVTRERQLASRYSLLCKTPRTHCACTKWAFQASRPISSIQFDISELINCSE